MKRSSLQIVLLLSCALLLVLCAFPEQALAYRPRYDRDLDYLWRSLLNTLRHPPRELVIAAYVSGVLCLVYGYKVYQFIIMLPGFLVGGIIGYALGFMQWGTGGGIFCGMLGAGFCGALAWWLHQLAIFVVGALLGGGAAFGVAEGLLHTHPNEWVVIIAALIGGGLLLALAQALIIVKASCIGAVLVAYGARSLDNVFLLVGLTLAGIAIQFGVAKLLGDGVLLPWQHLLPSGLPGAGIAKAGATQTSKPEMHHAEIVAMVLAGRPLGEVRRYYHQHHNIHPRLTHDYLRLLAGDINNS